MIKIEEVNLAIKHYSAMKTFKIMFKGDGKDDGMYIPKNVSSHTKISSHKETIMFITMSILA